MEIAGATTLVTGAAQRIGRVLAIALAEEGADVVVHYNTSHYDASETVRSIRNLGRRSEAIQADLSYPSQCSLLWEESIRIMGVPPRIVINNASLYERSTLGSTSVESWNQAMAVNVRAPFLLAKSMADSLGRETSGRVVNINDQRQHYRSRFAYGVTVAALSGLTRSLAMSLSPRILVNEVLLGPILPPIDGESLTKTKTEASNAPPKSLGTTDEVARAVLSLIADESLNGASVQVGSGTQEDRTHRLSLDSHVSGNDEMMQDR